MWLKGHTVKIKKARSYQMALQKFEVSCKKYLNHIIKQYIRSSHMSKISNFYCPDMEALKIHRHHGILDKILQLQQQQTKNCKKDGRLKKYIQTLQHCKIINNRKYKLNNKTIEPPKQENDYYYCYIIIIIIIIIIIDGHLLTQYWQGKYMSKCLFGRN